MSTTPLQKPILRDPPVMTPALLAASNSARIVRRLRDGADGFLTIKEARVLLRVAADEIERLQQLPLFPEAP